MKKLSAGFLALAFLMAAITPAHAARVFVGVGYGGYGGYGGYYPYPAYGYPYYYPYYVAPPPVVYAVPSAPPPVVVAPTTYQALAPAPITAPVVSANQTSPTFIDNVGRTCRHFQSTSGGAAYGTACLQPDGSWRSVQ